MSELRPLRLLNSVENGTVLGAELNTYLSDAGRLAEFTVLFSQRGQAKRIANGQTTMTAIVNSIIATNAAFLQATSTNDTIVAAIVESALAMSTVSDSASVLQIVSDNTTSWSYFSDSIYYESHIKKIISHLSGVDPSLYGSTSLLILDPVSMGDISVSERGMRALVNSLPTVTIMAGDSVAMALVAADTTAITLVAQNTSIMPTIANNVEAMDEIVSRSVATALMASNAGAIQSIANNSTAWANYLTSPTFSDNLKNIVANIAGLTPSDYADVNAIIGNATALTAVASNSQASQALATSSSATTTLASSPNLSIILGSATAMAHFGTEASILTFLNVSSAVPTVFGSSIAKGVIAASGTLVDFIGATSSILSYLAGFTTTSIPASLRSSALATTSDDPFDGIPSKVLVLGMRANNIGAIAATYSFNGSVVSGTNPGTGDIGLKGSVTESVCTAYTDPTWTVGGIAVTAAVSPEWTWYDLT
mgnify:FL=1|tara:strand:- start:3548 stop:4990 length:1443 start_codon:yes stop_codon:yes gene_type:complete